MGEIDEESKKLIRTTRESLDEAIKLCKPGALFRDLGKAMCVFSFFATLPVFHFIPPLLVLTVIE